MLFCCDGRLVGYLGVGVGWRLSERSELTVDCAGSVTVVCAADDLDNKVNRLKWMLRDTMGCPETFEMRRAELAANAGVLPAGISDEEVVQSYIETGPFADRV